MLKGRYSRFGAVVQKVSALDSAFYPDNHMVLFLAIISLLATHNTRVVVGS
jgi:hypothetical protein